MNRLTSLRIARIAYKLAAPDAPHWRAALAVLISLRVRECKPYGHFLP